MKKCSKCHKALSLEEFSPSSGGKYLRPECRQCARELSKKRNELRDEHGYPLLGYLCPICLKGINDLAGVGGNASIWALDHNHDTGAFRGYLCHNCNRGLGVFQDSIERLQRAIEYLSFIPTSDTK